MPSPGQVRGAGPLLSVVIPTFNERDNVEELVRRLEAALAGTSWEAIFVDDDSTDGTVETVLSLAQADARVRCIQRLGRRGLSSACVEGILSSSAPYFAVMDADLQHDERLLPQMLAQLADGAAELVVGSRYVEGGRLDWQSDRMAMSRFATRLSRMVVRADLKDPLSGFFMMRRASFMEVVRDVSAIGFKILLDIVSSASRPLVIRELPYTFRAREHGESKLDSNVMWDYLLLLLAKLSHGLVPVRFLSFAIVGGFGVLVHMLSLMAGLRLLRLEFAWAQGGATVVAMTTNFAFNNLLTYSDRRLRGLGMLRGLALFYAACGVGAIANVGVASAIFERHYRWWLAGFAGMAVGVVWNYAVTANFVWRKK